MTLVLGQRPITGLQMAPTLAEPVRRVAHLSGLLLHAPYPDARTACSQRKRPSRTRNLSAIPMPNPKHNQFNDVVNHRHAIYYKKRRAAPIRLHIMGDAKR